MAPQWRKNLRARKPNCGHAHAPPPAATPAGLSHKHALPRRGQSRIVWMVFQTDWWWRGTLGRCPYRLMRRCFSPEVVPSGEAPVEEGPWPGGGGGGGLRTYWCCGIDHSRCWGGDPGRFCWGSSPGRPCGTDVPAIAEKEFTAVAEDYFLVFGLNDAVVLTTAVAGAASPAVFDWYWMPGHGPGKVGVWTNVCVWSSSAIRTASVWPPASFGRFFPIDCEGGAGDDCYFPEPQLWDVAGSLNHWIGWSAGHGGLAVVFATSAGSTNGTIVGGGTIDATVASTETDSSRSCLSDNIGGPATGQWGGGAGVHPVCIGHLARTVLHGGNLVWIWQKNMGW